MTIAIMYGFRYRGEIYSISPHFHLPFECSFPSYYRRAASDLFRQYSREQIIAALDNVRANAPIQLENYNSHSYKDVAVVPAVEDNDPEYLELRANAIRATIGECGLWTVREGGLVPKVHRFQDVFVSGDIIQIDSADCWVTQLFKSTDWFMSSLAFLIDLDADRLVTMVNQSADDYGASLFPPELLIHKDRAPPPGAKFPVVTDADRRERYEMGAFYLTTPLSELME